MTLEEFYKHLEEYGKDKEFILQGQNIRCSSKVPIKGITEETLGIYKSFACPINCIINKIKGYYTFNSGVLNDIHDIGLSLEDKNNIFLAADNYAKDIINAKWPLEYNKEKILEIRKRLLEICKLEEVD